MGKRLRYLAWVYGWTVTVFILAKVAFMLCCREGHAFTMGDMVQVIWHGLSLDLSTALYFLILPFLLTIASLFLHGKWLRLINKGYLSFIALVFALAFVADTSLYPFWGFKLDSSCLMYLDTPGYMTASVSTGYLIVRLVVLLVATAVICLGYPRNLTIGSDPVVRKWAELAFYVLCMPLMVIGIRGGLDESTTNIGQVYFSQDQFLNHSAVNPVFSFLASFEKTANMNERFDYMSEAECQRIVSRIFNTESIDADTLLNTQTPNIILILMESCGGEFTEISGRQDITPHLNRLAHEGIYFTNCYANSWRTDRGTVCTYSGYPSFPNMSLMKMPAKSRNLPCIAKSLKEERGYNTHYIYGGDINFTNMRSYLIGGGFETLTWKADYSKAEQGSAEWGVRDDITCETLYQLCTTMKEPFMIGYSTLSSHAPWDVPIKHFDDEILNAFYYLDQCLGDFIGRLKQTPVWDNTLVILLSDHGILYKDVDELNPLMNHIPMIWIGGAVKEARSIGVICNQTDLPATLLSQLGLNHDAYTFSRDVLSKSYTWPVAINTFTEGYSMVDSTGLTVYDLYLDKVIKGNGDINIAKAMLQAASKDLMER